MKHRKRKLKRKRKDKAIIKRIAFDMTKYVRKYDPENEEHRLYCLQIAARESTESQRKDLIFQLRRLHCFAEAYNLNIMPKDFRVVASVLQCYKVENAKITKKIKTTLTTEYSWLADIAGRMYPLKAYFPDLKFALLFESLNRIVRPDDWTPENRDASITEEKLKRIVEIAHFPIFTVWEPEISDDEIVSNQIKLNAAIEKRNNLLGIKSPKPKIDRKQRYTKFHKLVIQRFKEGLTYQEIFELYKSRRLTIGCVNRWIQGYKKRKSIN